MEKILLLLLFVLSTLGCSSDEHQEPSPPSPPDVVYDVVIDLKMPGTLASNVPNKEFKTLKIKGGLNGTDIKFLRGIINNLSQLDLGDAGIVEGGESYYNLTHKTKNNVIGTYMFTDLKGSFSIILPKSVTTIEELAFSSCKGLKSVELPAKMSVVGNYAFENCVQLSSVVVPEGATLLGHYMFENCSSLTSVKLPSTLEEMKAFTFYNCDKLTSLHIPKNVSDIGGSIVIKSSNVTSITVDEANNFFSSIDGVLASKDKKTLWEYPNGLPQKSYEVPAGVSIIGSACFRCNPYIQVVYLPSSLNSIEGNAFYETYLREVHSKATTPPKLATILPPFLLNIGKLFVPRGCKNAYENSPWTEYFQSIQEE